MAVRRSWDAVVDVVKDLKRTTWVLLQDAQVLSVDAKTLTLAFGRIGNQKGFAAGANGDFLNDALERVLGRRFELTGVVAGTPAPTQTSAAPAAPAPVPSYEGLAPGDEIEPEDPDLPQPERVVSGEDAALKLLQEQLGGTVLDS